MNTPDSSGCSQRTQRGMAGSARAGFETRKATQAGSIVSPSAKASRSGDRAGRAPQPAQQRPELVLDDPLRQVLVGQPLAAGAPGVGRRRERGQDVVVEEVGERAVADVVEQSRHPERLDDEALGREGLVRAGGRPAPCAGSGRASAPTARPRA